MRSPRAARCDHQHRATEIVLRPPSDMTSTNVQAAFGEALVPAFEALIGLAPTLLAAIEDLGPAVRAMAPPAEITA